MSCSDIFLGLIAVLFPPIAVWIKCGLCSANSLINILLCVLGYIPGLLHAWFIIAKYPEHDYDRINGDVERQERVTYYYISHEPAGRRTGGRQGNQNYGTVPVVPGNKPLPQPNQYQRPQQPNYQPQQTGVIRTNGASDAPGPATSSVSAGSDDAAAPPSYSEVVRGDNKIQTQD